MARTSKSRGVKGFNMRSGNKSTFRMMGSSPARRAGSFVTRPGGERERIPFDEAIEAERTEGNIVEYTHDEYDKRMDMLREENKKNEILAENLKKDLEESQSEYKQEMTKTTRKGKPNVKDALTDRAYQDLVEGKELTDSQKRNIALDQALGGDKNIMDKTAKTYTTYEVPEGESTEVTRSKLADSKETTRSYPSTRDASLRDARFIEEGISGRGDQSGRITRSEAVDETEVPMTYKKPAGFKMKGHALKGIKQSKNGRMKDGRPGSSSFQYKKKK